MVSNMYDQCSHCFKMYHVNINTSYQIAGFGLSVWLETGWCLNLCGRGSSRTQDGKGLPLETDVWTPVCFWEALPASGYVIFPRGDSSSSGSDASSEKNAVCHRPGNTPSSSLGFPHACSSEGTAVLPLSCFQLVPAEPLECVCVCVWSLEHSFSPNSIVKTTRSLVSSEWFDFTDIWPTFSSKWALWMLKRYMQWQPLGGNEVWGLLRVTEERFSFFSGKPSRGLKKRCVEGSLHPSLNSSWKGWHFQTAGKDEKQQEMLEIRKWGEIKKPWRLVIKRSFENFMRVHTQTRRHTNQTVGGEESTWRTCKHGRQM